MPNEIEGETQELNQIPTSSEPVEEDTRTQFEQDFDAAHSRFEQRKAVLEQLTSEITALSLKIELLERLNKPLVNLEQVIRKIRDKLIELEVINLDLVPQLPDNASFSETKMRTLLLFRDRARVAYAMNLLLPLFRKLVAPEVVLQEEQVSIRFFLNKSIKYFERQLPIVTADTEILLNRYFNFFETPFEEAMQGVNTIADEEGIKNSLNLYGDERLFTNLAEVLPNRKNDLNKIITTRKQIMHALIARDQQLKELSNET